MTTKPTITITQISAESDDAAKMDVQHPKGKDASRPNLALYSEQGYSRKFRYPLHRQTGVEVLPGIDSYNRSFRQVMRDFVSESMSVAPSKTDADGFAGSNAIVGDMSALLTVAGHSSDPGQAPALEPSVRRNQKGLANKPVTSRHSRLLDQVIEAMIKDPVYSYVPLSKLSSSGAPFEVSGDDGIKMRRRAGDVFFRNWPDVTSKSLAGKKEDLFRKYRYCEWYSSTKRLQADGGTLENGVWIPKERLVPSFEAMLRGDFHTDVQANKTVIVDGQVVKEAFATRNRLAYAGSASFNVPLSVLWYPFIKSAKDRFEFSIVLRGANDLLAKLRERERISPGSQIVGVDVSQFDTTYPDFIIEAIHERLDQFWKSPIAEWSLATYFAPMMALDPRVGQKQHAWVGDPMGRERVEKALPSGWSPNPFVGKIAGIFAGLVELDELFGNVLEVGVDKILEGAHPEYAILNSGDDMLFLIDQSQAEGLRNRLREGLNPYFVYQLEDGISYLGNVVYRTAGGDTGVAPNMTSYFVNYFVPERGIGPPQRPYFNTAWHSRQEYYRRAPLYGELTSLFDDVFRTHLRTTPDAILRNTSEGFVPRSVIPANDMERLILADPQLLLWRFDTEDDINQDIVDSTVQRISPEECAIMSNSCWKQEPTLKD